MKLPLIFIALIFITGCAATKYSASEKKYRSQVHTLLQKVESLPGDSVLADSLIRPQAKSFTPNFGLRKPSFVIIHHTAQNSCETTLETFANPKKEVSAHYVICKDGTLHHLLNDYLRAWHAGAARWGNEPDINSNSIGIELDNNGTESFTNAQLNTLEGLLRYLKKQFNINTSNFIGHGDIAPGRKTDPSAFFNWKALSDQGFGQWYGDTSGVKVPAEFDAILSLRIIGYDISNPQNALRAFRRHFENSENDGSVNEADRKILFQLCQKYL